LHGGSNESFCDRTGLRAVRAPSTRALGAAVAALSLVAVALLATRPRPETVRTSDLDRPRPPRTPTSYAGPDPVVGAAGDIACDPRNRFFGRNPPDPANCRDAATAAILTRERVDAVLALGDVQYESARLEEFQRSYENTWGRLKDKTYPTLGNHEYYVAGAPGYFEYFGDVAGQPRQGYYSFDLGTWHLIALNSNCNEVACFPDSDQEKFLRADLAATSNRCVLAFWHHPRFSSGPEGEEQSVAPLWQALYDADADVVVNGHNHHYERFAPQDPEGTADPARGIRQFVVGTGGDSLQNFVRTERNSEVRITDTFGVLLLKLRPSGYDWVFVPTNPGAPGDRGSADCH
jgi:hypothetical protein